MEPSAPIASQAQAQAPAAAPQPISTSTSTLANLTPSPLLYKHNNNRHLSAQLDYTPQLYSPTQAEIDTHPIIVKRYSPIREEEVATGLGCIAPPDESHSRQETIATSSTMADKEIKEGDQVSWQWSGSRPGGTVDEIKDHGELSITSKKGNEIKKNADPEDPAVKVSRSGNDVVKRAHELDVEEEGDKHKEAAGEEKTVGDDDNKKDADGEAANGDAIAKTGEKRKAAADGDEDAEAEKEAEADEKPANAKKAKTTGAAAAPKANGEKAAPKKKGRPAKKDANGTSSKAKAEPKKKREPKKAATESGQPRRSGRNAAK
ncbi:hypothetical protein B0A55_01522 [Friedmanniomyces simplex]|uniref:Hypervirulence associated protein TUDOR domain-containing protein n=1 Tax=Friedmanniomyces simplex TaxID=329884 RepID=A0A4U0XZ80_9PEZI|nr:hypothetical protein B0A55_01522 [Friedmanniomyces simplex]